MYAEGIALTAITYGGANRNRSAGGLRGRVKIRFYFVFQNIAGLAFEMLANGFECGKADGFRLPGFEDGKILRGDVHRGGDV